MITKQTRQEGKAMLVNIPVITMSPEIAFTGTDEEIEKLENQENECSAAWRKIIENPDVSAIGFQSGVDYHIVSRCTDNHGEYRLTYFWNDGDKHVMDPSMHENYDNLEKLLFQLTTFCYGNEIVAEIA